MKNLIFFKSSLVFLIALFSFSSGISQHYMPISVVEAPDADWLNIDSITIDGLGLEYKELIEIAELFSSPDDFGIVTDLSAVYSLSWDYKNLYVFVEVQDSEASTFDGEEIYINYDYIQVYLDYDTSIIKEGEYSNDALFIGYNRGIDTITSTGYWLPRNGADLSNFAQVENGNGWNLEAVIPWISFLPEGTLPENVYDSLYKQRGIFGFDIELGDSDNLGGRDAQLAWDADGDVGDTKEDLAWMDTRCFGVMKLQKFGGFPISVSLYQNNQKIFPNPATDILNIIGLGTGSLIEIISITGEVIISDKTNSDKFNLDISLLLPGTYIARIINNQDIYTQTFLKK